MQWFEEWGHVLRHSGISDKSFFHLRLFGYDFMIETDAPGLMSTCLEACYGASYTLFAGEPESSLFRLLVLHWEGMPGCRADVERIELGSPDKRAAFNWDRVEGQGVAVLPPPTDPDSLRLVFSAVAAFTQCALKGESLYFIHASGVTWDDGAVLFAGPNNCGKSTLMRAMMAEGGVYLSDDAAPVKTRDGYCEILPSEETLAITGLLRDEVERLLSAHGFVSGPDTRFLEPPTGRKSAPPRAIFFPEASDRDSGPFTLTEKEAFLRILSLIKTPLSDTDAEEWFSVAGLLSRRTLAARLTVKHGSVFPIKKVINFCDAV